MDALDRHQVGALLLVEAVEVGGVLEVVGVDLAVLGGGVGQDVVGELLDLEGPAVLLELLLDRAVQDFGVGGGGGGHGDLLVIGGGLVLAAAG